MKTLCELNGLLDPGTVHVMVDLETWGTAADAAVSTIGAVRCPGWPKPHVNGMGAVAGFVAPKESVFSIGITLESALLAGLQVDPETVAWWRKQSDAAREEMQQMRRTDLKRAMMLFAEFLGAGTHYLLWGNGAAADPVWLEAAFRAAGVPVPWKHWQVRCYRTLKALCDSSAMEPVLEQPGNAHVALDDARYQMQDLQRMLQHLREVGKVWPAGAGEGAETQRNVEVGEMRDKKGCLIAERVMDLSAYKEGEAAGKEKEEVLERPTSNVELPTSNDDAELDAPEVILVKIQRRVLALQEEAAALADVGKSDRHLMNQIETLMASQRVWELAIKKREGVLERPTLNVELPASNEGGAPV